MYCVASMSYKGGSGRTTATANLAVGLARLGKRVLCLDLDFEAPGLHLILGVSEAQEDPHRLGTHHLLGGSQPLEESLEHLINVGTERDSDADRIDLGSGAIWLLPGSFPPPPLSLEGAGAQSRAGSRLATFVQRASERLGADVTLLDAASGVGHQAFFSLGAAQHILLFFRWTMQHVHGTRLLLKSFREIQNDPTNKYWATLYGKEFQLVATSVCDRSEIARVESVALRVKLEAQRDVYDALLRVDAGGNSVFEIPENVIMKWREQIVVGLSSGRQYEDLAQEIADRAADS